MNLGQLLTKIVNHQSLDREHPIGDIVWNGSSEFDPNVTWGGTWIRHKDVFLVAAGDVFEAGDTGGEATHTLTIDEMPYHAHGAYANEAGSHSTPLWSGFVQPFYNPSGLSGKNACNAVVGRGGGQPHNNLPPYLSKYCWERIA